VTNRRPIGERLRHRLSRVGLNRSMIVRRLVRFGHPRLRELAGAGDTPGHPLWRPLFRWLAKGSLTVPSGLGGGLRMDLAHLPVSHAHVGSIAFGNLEASVQEAMLRHLGKGGVFYDIGANLGFFALLGAHMAGFEEGHAYAFEPTPDNVAAIRRNAELNEIPNLTVIDKAVSATTGRAQLQVVDDQSWSKLADYGDHPLTEQVLEVDTVAIDDLIAAGEIKPPTVVKIDVEGAELAVLEGMARTLAEFQPVVICELHDTHAEFVEFCRAHGYRAINLEGTIPVEESGASAHALALPMGRAGD
jgi:FkbM family methyltransferase